MVSNTALQVLIDFVIVLGLRWLPVSVSLCYFPMLFSLAAEERKLTHGVAVSVHGVPFLPEVSQGQGRMLTRGTACLLSPYSPFFLQNPHAQVPAPLLEDSECEEVNLPFQTTTEPSLFARLCFSF